MEEEDFREEEKRIEAIREARFRVVRELFRSVRKEIDKALDVSEGAYKTSIALEYKVDKDILREKKERARRRH